MTANIESSKAIQNNSVLKHLRVIRRVGIVSGYASAFSLLFALKPSISATTSVVFGCLYVGFGCVSIIACNHYDQVMQNVGPFNTLYAPMPSQKRSGRDVIEKIERALFMPIHGGLNKLCAR